MILSHPIAPRHPALGIAVRTAVRIEFRTARRIVPLAVVASVLCGTILAPTSVTGQSNPPSQSQPTVYRIPITGTIELGLAPFVKRALRDAERTGARAAILDVNTLGGRVDAALQIVDAISSATVPVYALVHPRAISAGALISVAADSVFMTPDALLGASTVVDGEGEKVSEKAQSVMRAQYRALAERRGIDPRIGEAMVDEDIEIPGVVEKGKLLTLTAHEAARVGYAIEVRDVDAMLTSLNLSGAHVVTMEPNWAERLVRFLTHPVVAALLLPLGIIGILTEIKTPSFGAAGTIGVLAIALFFGSHVLVGLAGGEEVLLLAAGLILLALEVFVIPGFGIAGILGLVSIGAAVFLALLGSVQTPADVSRAVAIFASALGITLLAFIAVVRYLPQRKRTFGIFLDAATGREAGYISNQSRSDLLGAEGVTLTDLRPTGVVGIGTERVDVVSDAGFIAKDRRVRVVYAEPYRTVVVPVDEGATT